MSRKAVFEPEARGEYVSAVDWYESQAGLGSRLYGAIEYALDLLEENPGLGRRIQRARVHLGLRQFKVRTFPYKIIYIDLGDELRRAVAVEVPHELPVSSRAEAPRLLRRAQAKPRARGAAKPRTPAAATPASKAAPADKRGARDARRR